ncbi:hypothetical protein [Clostridium sp.]|uniref:hypothetical protein n=1 Tax=Clostridium sp. TaxID=1506 RepID=UPI00284ECF53|nr:hypothetical protein [Clostridium sp.]MDR3596562.1 hypothetical protein [Clostridium sp.]
MSGINTDEFMSISFDLQKIAFVLAVIGFIILKAGKLEKGSLKRHDTISTFGYLLVVLSVSYMINYVYDAAVSQSVSPAILIHSLIGIVILVLGFIFVINRRGWKIKRVWKNKVNMQILLIMWLANFLIGTYLVLFSILGRVRELLINSEKASASPIFEENVERFSCIRFSITHGHDRKTK